MVASGLGSWLEGTADVMLSVDGGSKGGDGLKVGGAIGHCCGGFDGGKLADGDGEG